MTMPRRAGEGVATRATSRDERQGVPGGKEEAAADEGAKARRPGDRWTRAVSKIGEKVRARAAKAGERTARLALVAAVFFTARVRTAEPSFTAL
jgi:hypothetical protein